MPARKLHRLRSHTATQPVPFIPGSADGTNNKSSSLATTSTPIIKEPVAPKHIPYISTIVDNDFVFEFRIYSYTMIGALCQFLHIYRSVWWVPYTHNNYPVNYFLIDPNLVGFILVMLSRRMFYAILSTTFESIFPSKYLERMRFRLCMNVSCLMLFCLICYAYNITMYSITSVFFLWYPFSLYLIVFGFDIFPMFELVTTNSDGLPPLHACTNVPADIRSEVEELKKNFNNRVKQILFNSVTNAYYAGFLPCCFVPNMVYYDSGWAAQHIFMIWFGCFTTYAIHALPVRYCDILHRAALHLGYWDRVILDPPNASVLSWHDDFLWPFGCVIEYGREFYRSLGEVNAAEPGNTGYSRFYTIFWDPPLLFSILLMSQVGLVLSQLILLVRSYTCWYCIVSSSLLLVFNYYTLYTIGRNYFVSHRLYSIEQALHEKVPH